MFFSRYFAQHIALYTATATTASRPLAPMSTFLADLPASVSAMAQKALEEEGAQHQPSYANTLALTLDEIVRDVADDETKIRVVRALCGYPATVLRRTAGPELASRPLL